MRRTCQLFYSPNFRADQRVIVRGAICTLVGEVLTAIRGNLKAEALAGGLPVEDH